MEEKMGKHMALEQAQALLERATANANTPQVVEQEQTVPVVERAIQQPEAIPVPVQEPVVVTQEPQQVVVETKPDVSSQIAELTARLDKAENAYKSLQGKYNKELPEARNNNAQLQAEISTLKDQLYKQASVQEIPKQGVKEYLGQDIVDELGENYVNMADSVTDFKINQALENERKRYESEIEELKKVQKQDKWNRYNQTVASQIPNFVELVDPYGNGTINEGFGQFLQENYMLQAFDDADLNMNSQVVVDICSKFNSYKAPVVVQQEAPVQVPVANPKAQAVAPPTSNNASPQSQASTPKFTHSVRNYIDKGQEFARGNMTTDAWLKYQASYDKAMAEGKVQR